MRVFKYTIPVDDQWHDFKLPEGAHIMHVVSQYKNIREVMMWVYLNDNRQLPQFTRSFRVYGTGHEIPEGCKPVGSCIVADGHLVWHLVENGQ